MSDWDASDGDTATKSTNPPKAAAPKKVVKSKWEGEDEEGDGPVSDWEASSEEEEEKRPAPAAAPPKKKGTLKAKIAEKEAEKAARQAAGDDVDYDSDEVLNPIDRARRDRERELQADLSNAADLLGATHLGDTSSKELDSILSFQPRTKEDFVKFSSMIIEHLIKPHEHKPLYAAFIEHHSRELAVPLRDVDVRKVASGLTALANEKQKEQRDKLSGKKKKTPKPVLGGAKPSAKIDTNTYDEALDDFGDDDFM